MLVKKMIKVAKYTDFQLSLNNPPKPASLIWVGKPVFLVDHEPINFFNISTVDTKISAQKELEPFRFEKLVSTSMNEIPVVMIDNARASTARNR